MAEAITRAATGRWLRAIELACLLACLYGTAARAQYGPYVPANGTNLFVVGLYNYVGGYWHDDAAHFGDIKNCFNTVDFFCHDGDWCPSPGENLTPAILDSAATNGLYITSEMWTWWDPTYNYCDMPSEFVVGSDFYDDLQTLGSYPALLMWAAQDEANTNYLPLTNLDNAELFMRTYGLGKPVWENQGGAYGNVSEEQPWAADCTVFSNDAYPDEGWGLNGPMECVDADHQVVSSSVPIMAVLPAYPGTNGNILTSNTMSYVAYTCIIHGAAGIWWWGADQLASTSDPMWQSVITVGGQLRQIQAALIHPSAYRYWDYQQNKWRESGFSVSNDNGQIHMLMVSDADCDYLITANVSTNSQTVTISSVTGWRGGTNLWSFCGTGGANQTMGQNITYAGNQVTVYASHAPPYPPVIGQQPVSQACYVGGTATFRVNAYGIQPLGYQWFKNGTAMPGQTNDLLTLSNLQSSDAGSYSVTVAGPLGANTSTAATLTVLSGYGAYVCGDGPVAYWPLNETNGTVAYDYVNGYNGTYLNSPTLGVAGATSYTGPAVTLNGQYLDISSNYAGLNFSGQISIEAWISPSSINGNIIAHDDDTGGWGQIYLQFQGSSSYGVGAYAVSGQGQVVSSVPSGTLNNWVHVVGTYDGTNWNVYQNGVLLGSAVVSNSGAELINGDWSIGSGTGNVSGTYYYGGIQDVAIYNYALSAAQIRDHYLVGEYGTPVITQQPVSQTLYAGGTASLNVSAVGIAPLTYQWKKSGATMSGQTNATLTLADVQAGDAATYSVTVSNPNGSTNSAAATLTVLTPAGYSALVVGDGPVTFYPLNETNGPVAHDYMNGYNGTYLKNPTLGAAGATSYTGPAVTLNGQYIDISNYAGLNFSGPITMEAWLKPANITGGNIIAHDDDTGGWGQIYLQFQGSGSYGCGAYAVANNAQGQVVEPVPGGTLNQWVHVVGTYDGTNWNVYQNGVLLGSAAVANSGAGLINGDWSIGSGTGNVSGSYYYGGIQDVAIYHYALIATQIQHHYLAGEYGSPNPPLQITYSCGLLTLTWPAGTLQQSTNVTGPYVDVPSATSPFNPATGPAQQFYRVIY